MEDIVSKIKLKANKTIYFKYLDYYDKIMSDIDFPKIQGIIQYKLDEIYETEILDKIKVHNMKYISYSQFGIDFSFVLKKQINKTIEESLE